MNGLHEYEAWLDTLDLKFKLDGGKISYDFDENLLIPINSCKTFEEIEFHAKLLLTAINKNNEALPKRYMIDRFLRLASEGSGQSLDQLKKQLLERWGEYNHMSGNWELNKK